MLTLLYLVSTRGLMAVAGIVLNLVMGQSFKLMQNTVGNRSVTTFSTSFAQSSVRNSLLYMSQPTGNLNVNILIL